MPPGPKLVVMVALAFISGAQCSFNNNNNNNNQQQRENHNLIYNNIIRGKLSKRDEDAKHYENTPQQHASAATSFFLSNINPWLSACDLAHPNSKTAPDLQGSCSAGSLPVSWIEEGPGPPTLQCPQECPRNPNKNKRNNNINLNTNLNNNNYDKYHVNDRSNQKEKIIKSSIDNKQQQQQKQQQLNNYNNNFNSNSESNNNNNKINNINNNKYDINIMMNRYNENRQCLDYLGGDNDDYSPSNLCKSSSDIETKLENLKRLRLRHCCERDIASALHNEAYEDVLRGSEESCVQRLNDLIESDRLADKITCEFHEILVRYDCKHRYSLIHHCSDCKESYRRWVCSTFIPYFAAQSDIKLDTNKKKKEEEEEEQTATTISTDESQSMTGKAINIDSKAQKVFMKERTLGDSNAIKRSRRKATDTMKQKRIRIRPCLSVCQTVEQICPYLLPADRAPAYPTQYAGEPTFLCLDPNIDETGNQLYKSNHGPSECCYDYCTINDGLCSSTCDAIFNRNNETATSISSSSTTSSNPTIISSFSSITTDDYDDDYDDGNVTKISEKRSLYIKLDNGTYVLNDFTNMPDVPLMQMCPLITLTQQTNVTTTMQSMQQCSISQAQVTSKKRSNSKHSSRNTAATIKLSSISILIMMILHAKVWNINCFDTIANTAIVVIVTIERSSSRRRRRSTNNINVTGS